MQYLKGYLEESTKVVRSQKQNRALDIGLDKFKINLKWSYPNCYVIGVWKGVTKKLKIFCSSCKNSYDIIPNKFKGCPVCSKVWYYAYVLEDGNIGITEDKGFECLFKLKFAKWSSAREQIIKWT